MKKYLTLFLGFVLLLTQLLYPHFAFAADKQLRNVRVGVYDNNPKIYRDADGNIKGFWADITNYIAEKENWNVVYVYDSWENNLKRLENGEIDLMVDVAVSEDRSKIYDFNNETVLVSWGVFYTRKGVKINSMADLEGKNIAILKSGILYSGPLGLKDMLSSFGISAKITDVSVYGDVFKLLDNGQADVGVVNNFYGIANEGNYKVDRTNVLFQPSQLKYALTKNAPQNKYLIGTIDADLVTIKDDPGSIYHQSIEKNFGNFVEKQETLPVWEKYLLITIGTLFALFILVFLPIRQYRKVLKQQADLKMENKELKEKIDGKISKQ
jgi:ABC-type amino acid transport substrate-binding protein